MAKQCILWLTTAALFLVTSTSAVPLLEDEYYQSDEPQPVTQCAVTCPVTSSAKFQYTPGKTYEYSYESDIKTSVIGTSAEHSSLHMRATVLLDVVSTCELTLRLTDVSLQDSDPTNYERRQHVRDIAPFKKALQDKALSFAFIDGRIESICPRSDDETWAVNIRRGILSTLQNTMTRLQGASKDRETDVAGNCPVKYEVTSSSAQSIKIKKTKDLIGCTDRHDAQTIFQGMPYSADSDIQSLPLMSSTYSCEQEINSKTRIMTKSSCSETHAFRPFARWNSGATTEVTYKMMFRRMSDTNQRPDNSRRVRSTMLFDHSMSAQQSAEAIRETQQTLQQLCQKTQTDIRPDVPGLFTKLVHQMKRLDTPSLRQLMSTVKSSSMCNKAEKFYRDALPIVGTTAAISTMRQLMRDGSATEKEVDAWMSALAFIKNPTQDMIKELKPLVELNMQKAALPVSALINTYCQLNDGQQSNNDVLQIVKLFEDQLRYNCRVETDDQITKMLTALRAIGNAGLGAQSAAMTLTRCASNEATPMSIRVAAVNAFRRIDCKASGRNELFKLLENRQADSELRINAYLAVMQCATDDTLQRVQTVLESDEVNQVLSFIWTHLTNLRETASPLKRQIRAILENAELKKEFNMDKRKFSRNIELSTFSELLNVGGTVESNLIWSGQSFVPRSASLNLTVDMFGRSINLFEVGGRIQGAEDILERILGPGSDIDNAISANKRERRAPIREDMFNTLDRTFDRKPDSDHLSYYIRVFGNEIRAGDIFAFDLDSLKSKFNFFDWLIELAKDHNIDITKSFHFLDANVNIPTGTGFPLRLNAEGSATVGLSARGKIDVRQMLSTPSNFDINGSVKPSAAIEVRASMGVDGRAATTGLKIVNTLHSSTVLDGLVQLRDGRVFNFDWNLPQDKVEIFNAESHVYVTYRDQDREQSTPSGKSFEWKKCTSRDVAEQTGLEMCGEFTTPQFGTGSIGATVARFYINKLDTYKGLHFDASYIQSSQDGSDTVRVSFNLPESRTDREMTATFTLRRPQRQFQLNVKSPWKKFIVDGAIVNERELKKASLKAIVDERQEYSISTELQIAVNDKQERRYSPKLKIVIPNRSDIVLDGAINITPKKYDVKLALKNLFRDPITTEGWIQIVDKKVSVKYDVSMQIGAPYFKGNLTGYTSQTIDGAMKTWASRAVMLYTYNGGQREQFIINHKFRDQSVNNLKSYSTDCSWTSSLWPRYNGQAGVEVSFSANSVRTKIEAGLDDSRKVTIITSGAYDFYGRDKKFNGFVKFTLPYKDWNYEVKVDHSNNWESLQSNATVRYGNAAQQRVTTVDLGLRKEGDHPLSLAGELRVKCPGREMSIVETLVERAPREYSNVAVIQWQRGQDVRIETTYKMQPRHEVTNVITAHGLRQPIRINGHVLPNLKNAQARVEVIHDGKNYFADGSWSLRGTLQQFNARVNTEVSIAGRGLAITSEVSRREQEISGTVEAIYNGNQRYSASTQVTTALSAPKFQTRIEWPGENFLQLSGSGKYEQRGWQSTSNDLEANVKLTSSIDPIREISVGFVHDQTANGCKTNGEVSWAADKKITGELSLDKSNKASLTLTTPFNGYRSIKAEGSYQLRGRSGTMNAKMAWDGGKQIVLMITGDANQPDRLVTGKVTFNSPFRGFESLAANLRYNVASDKHTANADFSWARGRQVALTMTMNHQRDNWYITNNGELTVSTPFNGMRSGRMRWQHQNTAESWKCKNELEIDGRKFAVDVDTSHRVTAAARRVTGQVSFQCPVIADWLQNASVTFDYMHDLRAWKSVGKSEVYYGSKKFGYEHDFSIEQSAAVIKAKLITPFQPVREIGISLNNRRQGNGWTANNEIVMGSHGRIALDGSYQRTGANIDATVTFQTPYEGLERISASLRNQKQRDGAWMAHADMQYAVDKQIVIDGKLGLEAPQKVFELEVKSPCPQLRQARAAAYYSGTARNFQGSVDLSHNALGRNKITAAVSANTENTDNMNVQLTVRTPFSDFSSFKVTGRHVRDTREHTATTATWELNRYRGSALADMKIRGLSDFDGRYELEYTAGRKLELTTSFKVDPKIMATASFKSPFESARTVTAMFNQEGPLDNFRISSEVTHNDVNQYTSGLDFAFNENSLRTSFRLSTPYQRIERVATAFSVAGRPTQFNLETSFELNKQKVSKTMSFELGNEPSLKLTGKLETTYEPVRQIIYSVNHNGPARNFNNNLNVNINGAVTSASSEFRLDGPSMKFEVKTPYRPLTLLTLTHTTKPGRTFAGWQNTAAIEINGQRYNGDSSMGWKGKELQVRAAVNIPQEYSVVMSHKAESTVNFDTIVNIRLADKTIKKTISLKTNLPALIDFKSSVETNYRGYELFNATFKHEGSQVGFKSTAAVTTPLRQMPRVSAELTHRFTSQTGDFTSTLKLQLPLQSARQITTTLTHRGNAQDLNSNIAITVDDRQPVTAAVTFKNTQRAIEGSLNVVTPFQQLSSFNGEFRHAGQNAMNFITTGKVQYSSSVLPTSLSPTSVRLEHSGSSRSQFKSIADITIPAGKHSATLEYSHEPMNFRSSLKVTTPRYISKTGQTDAYEATVEVDRQPARASITLRAPLSYVLTATQTGTDGNMKINGELTTPHQGWTRTAASWSHTVNWPSNVEMRGSIETAIAGWERIVVGGSHTGGSISNFRSNAYVETSRPGYGRMSATASNAVDRRGAKTSLQIDTTIPGYKKIAASSDLSFKGSGWSWNGNVETPVRGYERWSSGVEHNPSSNGFRTSVQMTTPIRGYERWAGTVEHAPSSNGFRTSVDMTSPIRGYERWTGAVEHAPSSNGFRTSVQMTSPIRGYEKLGAILAHTGNSGRQFQTTLSLTTPCPVAPQIDVTVTHRGATIADFACSVSVTYGSDKKIEASVAFKADTASRSDVTYEGNAKLATTICPSFKDFVVTASHNRKPDLKSGALTVTMNGDKKVDFDYSYTTSGNRRINLNIRSPQSVSTEMNVGGNGQGSAVVSWNRRQIRFDFGLKDIVNPSMTDRFLTFRVTVPSYQRTVGFGAGYTVTAERFGSRGELYWDSDVQPDFQYEIEASKTASRQLTGYEGRLKVTSGLFNTDSTFSHRIMSGGSKHKTEIVLNAAERLTIKSDLTALQSGGFNHIITIQHPKFSKDVTLSTEATPSGFKTTLDYEQQSWILEGRMNKESMNDGSKYTTILRLANPNSQLDVQLVGDCAISKADGTSSSGIALKYYMSRDRQMKTLAGFRADINKPKNEIKLELTTPIDTMRLSTTNREIDLDSGVVRYDITYECSHYYFSTAFDFSRPEGSLDIKFYTAQDAYVEAFAQALSPTQVTFELSHTKGDERITDVQLSSSYSQNTHLVTGRTFVRPDLSNDIRTYFDQAKRSISTLRTRMSTDIDAFTASMQNDGRMKSRSLQQAVVVPLNKVGAYVSAEVRGKADEVANAVNAMYRDNEFYMRDIYQALKRHYDDMSRRLSYKTAELRRKYAEWSENVSEQLDAISDTINTWNDDIQQRLAVYWDGVSKRLQQVQPDFDKIRPYVDKLIDTCKAKLTEFLENLRQSKSFRNFLDRVSTMHPSDYITPPSQWQAKLEAIADKIDQWLQEVLSKPEAHYVRDWVVKSMQNNNWLYKMLGVEQQVNEWILQLRSMTWETFKTKAREFANKYLKIDENKWTVWDTQRGEYVFQIHVPFEMPDISVLSRFDPRPTFIQAKNWVIRQLPDEDTSLLDIVYAYKPPSDIREWVPPFKTHASLTGAQHYLTFDRRFFEFAGECSYLLARDFIGGTFSVIVNYDRPVRNMPVKKSLSIITAGRQVEVFPDAKVTVDGTRVEMPVRIGNTTVMRRGNMISVYDDWRGIDVTCDLPHDHCTLAVSGWYYGKTAGLFGTYDNEPSNDFTHSDKTIGSKPETAAESWTVGQRCRPINRAVVTAQPDTTTRRYRACAELFGDARSSMFRPCFKLIDPSSYMTMCLNDVTIGDNSLEAETDVCRPAAAYVHECLRHDIHLRMPKRCVRCEVPTTNQVFYELDRITLDKSEDIPRAADVVFVIQHAPCNRDVLDKITALTDSIDKAMRAEGVTSTRYAVVGFGGKKAHLTGVHTHTMDGLIFNTGKKLSLALDNFDTEASTNADAMVALRYTSRLPFRAGASKSVVLVSCDACRENTIRYSDMQRILMNNDIHLHVLVQDSIRLKSKSPKTAYIYGVDENTVYTRKDVAGDELAGEPDLRRYIRLPKDLCVALTMDTDGSVFSVRQWLDSRPLIQKQFVDVMVRTLARKAVPTDCQICECLADESLVGISQCQRCNRREPFYWLPPNFDDDEADSESTPSPPAITPDNNSRLTPSMKEVPVVTERPQTQAPARRPIPVRPTRRPVTPPSGRVTRRPTYVRPTIRPRVPPRQQ